MQITVSFKTFGCKQNQYDTDFLRESFERRGFVVIEETGGQQAGADAPDVVVINTCAVTSKGAAKCRQAIRAAARSGAKVVVTGCYSQVAPDEVRSIPGVIAVGGVRGRAELAEIVEKALESGETITKVSPHKLGGQPGMRGLLEDARLANGMASPILDELAVESLRKGPSRLTNSTASTPPGARASSALLLIGPESFEETPVEHPGLTRAFLKIQEGCGDFCAYCIVPYARGPSRSRPAERVLAEAKTLAAKGYKEIVLTGTHIGLYGKDNLPSGNSARFPSLPDLIRQICDIDGLIRLRISSLEPHDVNDDLLDCLRMPQVCPHLHLPLQSGSNRVLRAMGRRYDAERFLDVTDKARMIAPGAGITTDIIVGFPGETARDFEDTLEVAREAAFSRIHAFRFSPRPGTRASELNDKVTEREKDDRIRRLIALGKELSLSFHRKHEGRVMEVLVEDDRTRGGRLTGVTRNYIRCEFAGSDELKGRLAPVLVRKAGAASVEGELVCSRGRP